MGLFDIGSVFAAYQSIFIVVSESILFNDKKEKRAEIEIWGGGAVDSISISIARRIV